MTPRCAPWTLLTLAASLLLASRSAQAQESPLPERVYAVIVANNTSVDPGVAPLRYADDDGARYAELFGALADDVTLLTTLDAESRPLYEAAADRALPPTRANVLGALRRVQGQLARDTQEGRPTRLFVIFAGHGAVDPQGMGYLSLQDGRLTRDDLRREVLEQPHAGRTEVVIDACQAWFMVQARGDDPPPGDASRTGRTLDAELEAFLEERRAADRPARVGLLLSTSGAAEVHEWSRFGAGVFSHQVRSGLLGAADINSDRRVSWDELEAYLAAANARVTHPRARIDFFVRAPSDDGDEALLDLRRLRQSTQVEFGPTAAGRYHIEDGRGVRVADLHVAGDTPVRVALLWEPTWRTPVYFVRTDDAELRVEPGQDAVLSVEPGDLLARADSARGSVEEAFRSQLFAVPWGRAFFEGYRAALTRVDLQAPPTPTPLPPPEDEATGLGFALGAFAAPALFGLGDLQSNLDLAVDAWLSPRLALRLLGEYGTSARTGDAPFRLHRVLVGVGARGAWPITGPWSLQLDGRTGHQWVLHDGAVSQRADALSLRSQLGIGVGFALGEGWAVALRGGVALDIVTLDGREDASLTPLGGLVLEYRSF